MPFISHGQADTIYYDENGHRTEFDNADFYRVIKDTGKRYKVDEFTLSNKPKMSGYFIALDTNYALEYSPFGAIKDGPYILYNKNGLKGSEGNYEKNKRIGVWNIYALDSNKLWCVEHFTNDKLDGELLSYYESGKLKRRELHKLNDTTVTGKCFDENGNEIPFTRFETMPKAPYDVPSYLSANMKYPETAKEKNIEGRVITKFIVDTDGTIIHAKIVKGIGGGCDEEAIRVVSSMPKWTPATQDDKKAKVFFTLPILFKLD